MSTTKEKLLGLVNPIHRESSSKVSIVGVGQVGMACAFAILEQVANLFKNFLNSNF